MTESTDFTFSPADNILTTLPQKSNLLYFPRQNTYPQSELIQPVNSWLLPGSGFDVKGQVEMLKTDALKAKKQGLSLSQAFEEWLGRTRIDIKSTEDEYLKNHLVFPWFLDEERDAVGRYLRDSKYQKRLQETVTEQERWGSVKTAMEVVEGAMFGEAEEGDSAVFLSPPGPSGIPDRMGGEINYEDLYASIYTKEKVGVRVFTVKLGFSLEQSEDLLQRLIEQNESVTKIEPNFDSSWKKQSSVEERIANIVTGATLLKKVDAEKVIWAAQQIKRSNFAFKNRSFNEIFEGIRNWQDLSSVDELTEFHIAKFEEKARQIFDDSDSKTVDSNLTESLEKELGKTFLNLVIATRSGSITGLENTDKYEVNHSEQDYQKALAFFQTIDGCNGGGIGAAGSQGFSNFFRKPPPSYKSKVDWFYREGECNSKVNSSCKSLSAESRDKACIGPCGICLDCERIYDIREKVANIMAA